MKLDEKLLENWDEMSVTICGITVYDKKDPCKTPKTPVYVEFMKDGEPTIMTRHYLSKRDVLTLRRHLKRALKVLD